MENWPVSREAQPYLNEIKESFVPRPIHAYDEDDNLISPDMYEQKLKGAIVEIHFTLSHWGIVNKNDPSDTYSAHISHVQVISPPKLVQIQKHKLSTQNPLSSKRRKQAE
jgi:hypothetical protein